MEEKPIPASPTILLVDDDEEDRLLMRMALESLDLPTTVKELESGDHLLKFLEEDVRQQGSASAARWIVMLDKYMPGLNGFETLRLLKEHEIFREIPVVLFINTQNENELKLCIDLGAMTCINKPLHFSEMKELMHSVYQYWVSKYQQPGATHTA
ncbi:response regulator [Tellurirhabdus rosea]|uniref:response regulator n=1 Tax=Tellurirhabdus rosea TaxID=2674997 RepID=UPI002253C3C2|nr:response regulator [Tellurirhabdus rosea]